MKSTHSPTRHWIRIALLGCALLGCFAIFTCHSDDTVAVRKVIDKAAHLAEAHQVDDLLGLTTPDFKALPGGLDASGVKAVLQAAFSHYGAFDIRYPRPNVDVDEETSSASAVIYFMIVSQDLPIPGLKKLYKDPRQWMKKAGEKADLYQLKLDFLKKDGQWWIGQAELEGFKGWGF